MKFYFSGKKEKEKKESIIIFIIFIINTMINSLLTLVRTSKNYIDLLDESHVIKQLWVKLEEPSSKFSYQ